VTIMTTGTVIDLDDLPKDFKQERSRSNHDVKWNQHLSHEVDNLLRRGDTAIYEKLLQTFEKEVIASALRFTNGKKIEAANLMGIGRNTITRKISELGLSVEKRKEEAST